MIVKYEKMIAYICPFCSNLTRRRINAFEFSAAEKKRLRCSTLGCREECADVTSKGGKYKISVECPICGDAHTYTADQMKFWNKRLISYKCPVSGIDIMFCGDEQSVDGALAKNAGEYCEIIPDYNDGSEDSELLYEILDCVHDLCDERRVSCVCRSESISIQIINDSIVLVCDKCGRARVIDSTEHNLAMLLNAEAIVIGN